MDMLNVGCGRHFHPAWTNVDLVAAGPGVRQHDLLEGLPFPDGSFDAVYHSHVLEHLDPQHGQLLIRECFRVLRPGGTLRVAVPDLETIARCYLEAMERVDRECSGGWDDYEWMTLELLDQMVRQQPGGRMAQFVHRQDLPNRAFVRWRMGEELFPTDRRVISRACGPEPKPRRWRRTAMVGKASKVLGRARWVLASAMVKLLLGRRGHQALHEGMFRQSGEIHRWMYDRLSLRRLLERAGFTHVAPCGGEESRIASFSQYELDVVASGIRKPDSLFMEGSRPAVSHSGMADGQGQAHREWPTRGGAAANRQANRQNQAA